MISVEEAQNKILSQIKVLEPETRHILDVQGQVLAEDVTAQINIPPLDNSAMDGFAVKANDTTGADIKSPKIFKVIDTVYAGTISDKKVTTGTAMRIMTGAPVPDGADAVVRFEDTDEESRGKLPEEIGILHEAKPGQNIRNAGTDIKSGAFVLAKGMILKPAHIGMLASLGMEKISVIRRPRIAVLATGNELTELDKPLLPGKLYNSNSYSIAAQVSRYGGIPQILGIARDNEDSLVKSIKSGLDADMLITTGGVSVGDYDVVKDVLMKQGDIAFWKVRMKPGKPVAFGTIRNNDREIPHLGLPGNPVSAMVTFELFGRPTLWKMMGRNKLDMPTVTVVIEDAIKNDDSRRVYSRAIIEKRGDRYTAHTTGAQGSHILTSMGLANGLVIVPEDKPGVKPGDVVNAIMLDWCGEEF